MREEIDHVKSKRKAEDLDLEELQNQPTREKAGKIPRDPKALVDYISGRHHRTITGGQERAQAYVKKERNNN